MRVKVPGLRSRLSEHSEFLMVLTLFVAFRLMLLVLFSPYSFFTSGFLGHAYYYEMAQQSDQGHYPFIHFWFEYPPVFPYLVIAIYNLTRLGNEAFEYFNRTLTLAVLPFDVLTLINLYRIGRRLYGAAVAVRLAWIYSLLLIPAYYWWHTGDSILVAMTMQSLFWLLVGRRNLSGIPLAIAIATKFTPAFLLPAAWRFMPSAKHALTFTALVLLVLGAIFLPFLISSPAYTLASFQSLASVSSWQTIWALIDGNMAYGDVGPISRHFDLAAAAIPLYNPSRVPLWITLPFFGLLFLFVFLRPWDRQNPRHRVTFSTITLMLFLLWSKGWSPQWATLVIPFWLLVYPNWRGVLLVLTLSFGGLLDWPLTLSLNNPALYVFGVLLRAGLFVLVMIDLLAESKRAIEK
jgi:hypothetical protein